VNIDKNVSSNDLNDISILEKSSQQATPPTSSSSSSAQFKSEILSLEDIQLANSLREKDPSTVFHDTSIYEDTNDDNDVNDASGLDGQGIEKGMDIEVVEEVEIQEVGVASSYDNSQSHHEIPYDTLEPNRSAAAVTTITTTATVTATKGSSNDNKFMSIQITQNDLKCIQSFIKNSGSLQVSIFVFTFLFFHFYFIWIYI
jgi:hypothetical protein